MSELMNLFAKVAKLIFVSFQSHSSEYSRK
jgi:hypothetical protein